MKNSYDEKSNGYLESIGMGLEAARSLSGEMSFGIGSEGERIARLKHEIESADAILIGAGAGLSTSAGLTYDGERFMRYFFDFAQKYGIKDMYSGGFYPFPDENTRWAWWARHIYFNRYIEPPRPVYKSLLRIFSEKDYFVLTANVDHQFQRAGFDKKRLFYTQGDYGLFQSVKANLKKTYDNYDWVMKVMDFQGFIKDENGVFKVPADGKICMKIPSELLPKCPDDGSGCTMNLRSDDSFVEDEGWHKASLAYHDFIERVKNLHVLYLELGVGANTPIIIKYPFWKMTMDNKRAIFASINLKEAFCPKEIEERGICIRADILTCLLTK